MVQVYCAWLVTGMAKSLLSRVALSKHFHYHSNVVIASSFRGPLIIIIIKLSNS